MSTRRTTEEGPHVKPSLLVVDDEAPLCRNLTSYLSEFGFSVQSAQSGEDALAILNSGIAIDLLLTDVRLPGVDGIHLLREAAVLRPELKAMVMTAFPSDGHRQEARKLGAIRYLEKPLDMTQLVQSINQALESRDGWSGSLAGLDLFDFTQLFTMSRKTTVLSVSCGDQQGTLGFRDGVLFHASVDDQAGDDAFLVMASWKGGSFNESQPSRITTLDSNVGTPASQLLMEAARQADELRNRTKCCDSNESAAPVSQIRTERKESTMAVKDHLEAFADIEGFQGAAVFTAQGEMIDSLAKGKMDIKTIGMFANNALLNAQKATDQMGVGRGNLMQIRAPQAVVLMRCLNEATDFAATKEGKAHVHAVAVFDPEGNVGMATMILDKIVGEVANEVR